MNQVKHMKIVGRNPEAFLVLRKVLSHRKALLFLKSAFTELKPFTKERDRLKIRKAKHY